MRLNDLPVSIELDPILAEEVARFVESEAGWQVVASDGPLIPALVLAGDPRPDRACVVVVEGGAPAAVVRDALLAGALDVIAWPHERARLLEAPLRVRATRRSSAGPAVFKVAAASGGAGASTLALAVGGLLAWSQRDVIVVGGDDLLVLCGLKAWAGPGTAELAQLDEASVASEVEQLARPVPGVPRLRVIGGGAAPTGSLTAWPPDAVVVDVGVSPGLHAADLVVARADAGLRRLSGLPHDVSLAVVESPSASRAEVRRLLGRPPTAWLPHSARVARAGMRGRVPSALPGTWLAEVRALLQRVRR